MYARSLVQVGKLIYLIGNYNQTAQVKKILESSDGKQVVYNLRSKILYKCYDEVPSTTLRKIRYENIREGTIREDWISKMIDRYPEMVIFLYNCGDDSLQMDKVENILRDILKRINLFYADVLRPSNKEETVIRIIITATKNQFSNPEIQSKINYYLKTYEKDVFIIQNQLLSREINKYRNTWLGYLEKNYQKKFKKIAKKLDEANTIQKRICCSFKMAILSQILSKDEKVHYANAYNIIKYKFSEVTKKQFNFLRFLEIREMRVIADIIVLRYIKFKIGSVKQLPQFIAAHLNFFKMRTMEPSSCHFYYYYQQLIWRSALIQNLLEVFYSSQIMELLPHVVLAQLINGLLSYLHKLALLQPSILSDTNGRLLEMGDEIYIGKLNFNEITDGDLIMTGISHILAHKRDYINKGIQIITRYKTQKLFKENQINFLNIYLIRFYLAEGKFSSIISIYHEILKIELNRCNYFLINELFNEIKGEMTKIDNPSKVLLYGVASLICDFFENKTQLTNHLCTFFGLLKYEKVQKPQKVSGSSLFDKELAPEAHVFKLKKSSSIFTARVTINEQIILSQAKFNIKIKLTLHEQLRKRLLSESNKLQLNFNQHNMIVQIPMVLTELDGQIIEREFSIEPSQYVRKDVSLKIEAVQLVMQNKHLVWVIERNQIVFERFDSTLFFCKIEEPEIIIESIKKIYYINEAAYFYVIIKGIEGCKVTSKISAYEQVNENTEFFMNLKQKKDLMNSKIQHELMVSTDSSADHKNVCWIKCNKLGQKNVKFHFSNIVEKTIKVGWRQKPLSLKSTFSTVKEINFNVVNLFSIARIFREAQTGNLFDNNIPINKKTLLSFYIKTNENIMIQSLGVHTNPQKIIFHKMIKMSDIQLTPGQTLKANMLFEIDENCQNQFQLFLTTLFIKWSRLNNQIPVQNSILEQNITINAVNDKILITFEQNQQLIRRKKSNLTVRLRNLAKENLAVKVIMESTENIYRIGQKSKVLVLSPKQETQVNFEVLAIHSGIFDYPPVKIFVNDVESKTSTANFLVYCK